MSCNNYNISQEPSLSGGGGGGGEVLWGALTGTLSNQTDLVNELNGKADVSHTHSTSDVTGLDTALSNKLEETDLKTINGNSIVGIGDLVITGSGSPSWGDIIGTLSLQTDLNTALLNKADVIHNHNDIYFTETEITTLLSSKSDVGHNHDTRYYTETEIDTLLSNKANTSHSHSTSDITGLDAALLDKSDVSHTHDSRYYTETEIDTQMSGKANTTHSHSTSDITGLDAALLDKSDVGHNHNDLYYTESEIDTALSGKANTSHNHDDRYYTETEIDTQMSGKQPTLVSGTNIKTINGVSLLAAGDIVVSGGGAATWGSITGTIASQTDLINLVATKADTTHIHDDRYYTETEIDTALSGKQATITAGSLGLDKLDIDGGTDIAEALADTDLLIVDNGATGTNVKSALSRLWTYISSKLTGAISTVVDTNLTASKALVSNASGKIEASTVTSTELGLLSGMTGLQAPLGYTPENVANKENTTLDTSTTKYPTNRLVKEYVDANAGGGGSLTNWTESTNTYSSIAQVQFLATNAASRVDANIAPKGTGAFYLGPKADGTDTGGNNRGTRAIELNLTRAANTQVASGTNSIAIGNNSTANNEYAVAIGDTSIAGLYGTAIGQSATATGTFSNAFGVSATASNEGSTAIGYGVVANLYGQYAYGSRTANVKFSMYFLNKFTTNATPSELFLDALAARITLQNTALYACEIMIIGKTSGAVTGYKYERRVVIAKGASAATTVLLGSTDVIGTDYEANAGASISITADTTNGSLKIEVTGIAATNISWFAIVKTTELFYA